MLLCFAITILAIVLLTFSKGIVYVVCFWLLSFTYGATAATMPSLTTDYLGSENAGLVCSLVMIGFGVASIGTSFLAKAVNTSMAFILAGVIAIVDILVTLAPVSYTHLTAAAAGFFLIVHMSVPHRFLYTPPGYF